MTNEQAWVAPLASMLGFAIARVAIPLRLRRESPALVRTNVDGRAVPAILAEPLLLAGLLAIGAVVLVGLVEESVSFPRMAGAAALVLVALGAAGRWDDLRGDERPRGFKGHLGAARAGALTGGIVKLIVGGVAGLIAGAIVTSGWAIVETGALVALTANLVNLLDRAPGRAGKVVLAVAVAVAIFGPSAWTLTVAGLAGALLACMPFDLGARAMLGDAGSNPLGGILGLGLAVSMGRPGRLVAIGVLLVLNALSEKYSFSRGIERVPLLRALDLLGRGRDESAK